MARYIRFEDYPFVAPALDALRLEAKRSRAELGFSQLRLVICFLHWHDLKEAPEERITSPLLLLPGRDRQEARRPRRVHAAPRPTIAPRSTRCCASTCASATAIELPEYVELGERRRARSRCTRSSSSGSTRPSPAVTLDKIDRPRIDLVIAVARKKARRVPQEGQALGPARAVRASASTTRTRARRRGRSASSCFTRSSRPRQAPDGVMHDPPRPIVWSAQPEDTVTKELYALKNAADDGGPYRWAFDLTSVTLAHFNYRNVSLVRDYASLMDERRRRIRIRRSRRSFATTRSPIDEAAAPLPLAERHEVVLADPTQARAVARVAQRRELRDPGPARHRQVADDHEPDRGPRRARQARAVRVREARGARRRAPPARPGRHRAAVDADPRRAGRQEELPQGSASETYEGWLAVGVDDGGSRASAMPRARARRRLLARGAKLEQALRGDPRAGFAMLSLLAMLRRARRAARRRGDRAGGGQLALAPRAWSRRCRALERVEHESARARSLGPARQRIRAAARRGAARARSTPTSRACSPRSGATDAARACDAAARRRRVARRGGGAPSRSRCARRPLVDGRRSRALLDPSLGARAPRSRRAPASRERERPLEAATEAARGWRDPLAPDDAARALVLAKRFEAGMVARLMRWLSPGWWKLRGLLAARFDVGRAPCSAIGRRSSRRSWRARRPQAALDERDARSSRPSSAAIDAGEVARDRRRARAPDAIARAGCELAARPARPRRTAPARGRVARRHRADRRATPRAAARLGRSRRAAQLRAATSHALDRDVVAIAPLRGPLVELDRAIASSARSCARYPFDARALEALVARRAIALALRERAPDLAIAEGSVDALGAAMTDAARRAARGERARSASSRVRVRFVERAQLATARPPGLGAAEKETKRAYAAGAARARARVRQDDAPQVDPRDHVRARGRGRPRPQADLADEPAQRRRHAAARGHVRRRDLRRGEPDPARGRACPSIYRAAQMHRRRRREQLPPTNFFAASIEADGERRRRRRRSTRSIASSTPTACSPTPIARCRRRCSAGTTAAAHESLIDFSNRAFYAGHLLTVPPVAEARQAAADRRTRRPRTAPQAAERLLERPISFHRDRRRHLRDRAATSARRATSPTSCASSSRSTPGSRSASSRSPRRSRARSRRRSTELARAKTPTARAARRGDGARGGRPVRRAVRQEPRERPGRRARHHHPERLLRPRSARADDHELRPDQPARRRAAAQRDLLAREAPHGAGQLDPPRRGSPTTTTTAPRASRRTCATPSAARSATSPACAPRSRCSEPARRDSRRAADDPVGADLATALRERGWEVAQGVGASRLRCDLAIRAQATSRSIGSAS